MKYDKKLGKALPPSLGQNPKEQQLFLRETIPKTECLNPPLCILQPQALPDAFQQDASTSSLHLEKFFLKSIITESLLMPVWNPFFSKACRCLCVLKHTCVWPRLGYDKEEVLLACAGKKLVLIFSHSHWFSAQHTARRLYYDFRPNLQICEKTKRNKTK